MYPSYLFQVPLSLKSHGLLQLWEIFYSWLCLFSLLEPIVGCWTSRAPSISFNSFPLMLDSFSMDVMTSWIALQLYFKFSSLGSSNSVSNVCVLWFFFKKKQILMILAVCLYLWQRVSPDYGPNKNPCSLIDGCFWWLGMFFQYLLCSSGSGAHYRNISYLNSYFGEEYFNLSSGQMLESGITFSFSSSFYFSYVDIRGTHSSCYLDLLLSSIPQVMEFSGFILRDSAAASRHSAREGK